MDDEDTPAYCTSTTRLLKCPTCGTLYYYNHIAASVILSPVVLLYRVAMHQRR